MKDARRTTSGRRSGQRFDAAHGVVTEALIFLGELDPEAIGDAMPDATHYEPTPLADIEAILDALPDPHRFTFVDIGAGMGRVAMLASLRPFRQIVGVEVSAALCETARDNIVRWRSARAPLACSDIRIVRGDARRFHLPPGALAVYLYNPFGEESVAAFADRLARETPEDLLVAYHTPVHRAVFEAHASYELERDLGFACLYRKR